MINQSREVKKCWESKVVQTHRVFPGDVNSHRTLFGGRLMSYIDDTASISASRHSRSDVVTASMDTLDFLHPIHENHSVCIESYVTGAGNTSMEVFCKIMGEELSSGERYLAATSFITFVAVSKVPGEKRMVPLVEPTSKEEQFICSGYESRKARRMSSRSFHEEFAKTIENKMPWSE